MTDQFFSTRGPFEPVWTNEQLGQLWQRILKVNDSPDQEDSNTGETVEMLRIKYTYELNRSRHSFSK